MAEGLVSGCASRPHDVCARTSAGYPSQALRHLADHILVAFHQAYDQQDFAVAEALLQIPEKVVNRPPTTPQGERRRGASGLVAAHEQLWSFRYPSADD